MAKTPSEIEQLDKIKAAITDLPDEKDGLDLRQYKMQTLIAADQLRTHLSAVFKLAS